MSRKKPPKPRAAPRMSSHSCRREPWYVGITGVPSRRSGSEMSTIETSATAMPASASVLTLSPVSSAKAAGQAAESSAAAGATRPIVPRVRAR